MSIWKEPSSKNAFVLSWVSVVLEGIAIVAGIGYFLASGSALWLVFGLENCVDFFSSVVVVWRFFAPGKLTREREELLERRELRASILISFILVLLGISVIAASAHDFKSGVGDPNEMKAVILVAFISVFIFGILAIFKFHYARKLDSESLFKDGVCSVIGTVLAAALFVNTLIIQSNPNAWWLDPMVAMICGFVALIYGCQSIFVAWMREKVPVCSLSWWFNLSSSSMPSLPTGQGEAQEGANHDIIGASDLEMQENKSSGKGPTAGTNLSAELV